MQKIAGKLIKIMQECGYVQKNGINDFHHYKYATCADVLEKVNAALSKYGVASIVTPELLQMENITSNKGNFEHLATVKVNVTLIDIESGESAAITGIGSGQDSGDKAVMKAQTAAIKYAYLLSLAISTGDDPEAENLSVTQTVQANKTNMPSGKTDEMCCANCGAYLTKGVYTVSTKKFDKPLCVKCQKNRQGAA